MPALNGSDGAGGVMVVGPPQNEAEVRNWACLPSLRQPELFAKLEVRPRPQIGGPQEHLVVGDIVESLTVLTLRRTDSVLSDRLRDLPVGMEMCIVELLDPAKGCSSPPSSTRLRARVALGSLDGWVTITTSAGAHLVRKLEPSQILKLSDLKVGNRHTLKSMTPVRRGESLASPLITELDPGTQVEVLELGTSTSRLRVAAEAALEVVEGWIGVITTSGQLLVGQPREVAGNEADRFLGSSTLTYASRVRTFLQLARAGDVDKLRRLAAHCAGWMAEKRDSGRSEHALCNSADVRSRTALMYAASFCQVEVVKFLLENEELHVNAVDDTMKTALHHVARAKPSGSSEAQREVVRLLIDAGLACEARDHNGCTALLLAAAMGNIDVFDELVASGASVAVRDYTGLAALDYARDFGHFALARRLGDDTNGTMCELEDEDEEEELGGGSPTSAASFPEAALLASQTHLAATSAPAAAAAAAAAATSEQDAAGTSKSPTQPEVVLPVAKRTAKPKKAAAKGRKQQQQQPQQGPPHEGAMTGAPPPPGRRSGSRGARRSLLWTDSVATGEGGMSLQQTIKVEEEPLSPSNVEPRRQSLILRERAMGRLMVVMQEASAPFELELAIKGAVASGVPDEELKLAKQRLVALTERTAAFDKLIQAIEHPVVAELRKAIEEAEAHEVPELDLEMARKVLRQQEPIEEARKALKAAQESCNVEDLRAALQQARTAKLPAKELVFFEELLQGAESKEQAEEGLRKAVAGRSVAPLRFALQEARKCGADVVLIQEAEEVLLVEEPKQIAREELAKLQGREPLEDIEDCIKKALAVGLLRSNEPELRRVEALLESLLEQLRLMEEVRKVLDQVKTVDLTDLEAIKEAKGKLQDAILKAKEAQVPEDQLREADVRRRRLHNAAEDLKGSIRVFARVRPLSKREKDLKDKEVTKQVDGMTLQVKVDRNVDTFAFDAVFMPGTQEEVFEDCRDLVQSALDGYNVTIFAYGQTGAGKTFTMYGVPGKEGTTPRTIQELFTLINRDKARYNHTIMASMMELYRNELIDLLVERKSTRKSTFGGNTETRKYDIHVDSRTKEVHIEGLTEEECQDAEALSNLLERGNRRRSVAATAMNADSSRSHLILMIRIVRVNIETRQQTQGKILMCDLAGSERLKKSMVDGEMQKEAIEINRSLTALGDVIEALCSSSKHIPYKNHKLTQVMQDALGGTSKTLMFVNLSPAGSNSDETLNALKYASRAKGITNDVKKQLNRKASQATLG